MTINAGVQVGISKVNITIVDVDAELELIVRLGNCALTPSPLPFFFLLNFFIRLIRP